MLLLAVGIFANVYAMKNAFTQIWQLVRPYKGSLLLAMLLGLLLGQLSMILPAMLQVLIAALQGQSVGEIGLLQDLSEFAFQNNLSQEFIARFKAYQPQDVVNFCVLAIPTIYFFYGIVRYFNFFIIKFIGEKVVANLRIRLLNKFMDQDVMFLNRRESGSGGLLSRTLNDTLVLQEGLQYYGDLIREPITAAFIIAYMLVANWRMTLVCFLFLPVFATVIRLVAKSLKKYGHQSQQALEHVTKTLKEGLDGIRVIQSYNLQPTIKAKFAAQVLDYLHQRRKIIKREELGSPLNEWFASMLFSGILAFQANLIWTGRSDVPAFLGFLFAAGLLDKPIKKSQQAIIRIQQNIVSLERLSEILDSETQVSEKDTPAAVPADWQEIAFNNVSFSFDNKKVIDSLNLIVRRGESIAIVGESGSGKTTLVNLLMRFFDVDEGEIKIGGTNIKDFAVKDLRQNIGLVTQEVFLFDDTVENNVHFGDQSKDKRGVQQALEMANAMGFVEQMPAGLQSRVGERGARLSGGEKQRVSIARAFFKDAPVLILDEATSALDSASEVEVQKGIHELLRGRTAFIIAHRLSTIQNADRIIVMAKGKIIETGTHQELLVRQGAYARYHKLQTAPGNY